MIIDNIKRAAILSEALPYLRNYNQKTVVVKYGGAAMTDPALKRMVISDIVLLSLASVRMVVVHGGGPEINEWLSRINIEPKFIDGLRYTDAETMEVVQMVLAGKISKELAALAQESGGKAVSLCGMDGGIMRAKQLSPKYGQVGDLVSVNPELISVALDKGYIPIISSVAAGADNMAYNINADTAAGALAVALEADRLIMLSDVCGILAVPGDESSLINEISVSEIPALIETGIITGGMIPKLNGCVETIKNGVHRAHILDGRMPHAILMEMLTDGGVGTMITD
jgi:acetylglutamate kinase